MKLVFTLIVVFILGFGAGYFFSQYDFNFNITKFSSTGGEASTGEKFCDENIPYYQQSGCVRKPDAEQKLPSYQGKPCDPHVPMMHQRGCVEP